ncbi:MAG TPA: DUF1858 domain-containing protein, partial [Flavobacteriaceae bacterium]|nr:DUF1858 domain-containing protein [Flavobacteriaceae bacterium]
MKVNRNTKISTLLKNNAKAINAIVAISPHFKKLKNPVLRKLFASRVTVADACKIANVDETNFLSELEKIGFEVSYPKKEINTETLEDSINTKSISHSIDVRPLIDSGVDPFKELIKITSSLKIGEVLEV